MPVRRPGFIWSAPERLETRGLLSSAASLRADDFGLTVGIGTAAEFGSSSSAHAGNRISPGDGGGRGGSHAPCRWRDGRGLEPKAGKREVGEGPPGGLTSRP